MDVVLEWGNEQTQQLDELANEYFQNETTIKELTAKKTVLKNKICEMLKTYSQSKVLTENYVVSQTHTNGSRTADSKKLIAKLHELNVEIDDSYYKTSAGYDRLDVKTVDKSAKTGVDDPHRVAITAEDLNVAL